MKIWQATFALLALSTIAVLPVKAQTNCNTRCDNQFKVCQAAADAELEECLDRAETPRAKALCAVAFTKLEDACREKEAACHSNCGGGTD